jgi:MFS family permease
LLSALACREYRLLWAGQAISFLGDQFHLVALPWLVLSLTNDPLQLGLVLASSGILRAAFMLVGGAWADKHSPRLIMLVSDAIRFAVAALLAVTILTGTVEMWMIYLLAVVFGTVSGFFHPAANASIPRLLDDRRLESGNSLFQIADQAASFLGPAAAGVLIATFGRTMIGGDEVASLTGIGTAFAFDAASFALSALCLALMRPLPAAEPEDEQHPLTAIREGLAWVWREPEIRWMLGIIAGAGLFISGPLVVGLPVLANERLPQGALAFGLILSAFAGGNLMGMVGAGVLPRLDGKRFVVAAVSLISGFGIAIGALAFVDATWQAIPLMVMVGVGNGYMAVTFISQLQRVTPSVMLGRMMGLYMLCLYGLMPLSQALAGAVVRFNLSAVFIGAGTCLIGVAVLALSRPELRALSARLDTVAAEA